MLCPFCFWIPPPTHAHALSLCTAPRNCCRTRLDLSDFTEEERRKADRQANEIGECVFEIFCVCVCVCMCVCVWRLQQTGLTLILNCRFMPYTPTHCICLAPPPLLFSSPSTSHATTMASAFQSGRTQEAVPRTAQDNGRCHAADR